jgi:hypothetical protein
MNQNKPAFPYNAETGLSKREYTAIRIMAGIMASDPAIANPSIAAQNAVAAADALFEALDK